MPPVRRLPGAAGGLCVVSGCHSAESRQARAPVRAAAHGRPLRKPPPEAAAGGRRRVPGSLADPSLLCIHNICLLPRMLLMSSAERRSLAMSRRWGDDPLAGPWTFSRDRRDGENGANFGTVLGRIGSWSGRTLLIRNPGVRFRPAAPGQSAARDRAAGRPVTDAGVWSAKRTVTARRATPLLAVMTAVAVLLAWATVSITSTGFATTEAAARLSG